MIKIKRKNFAGVVKFLKGFEEAGIRLLESQVNIKKEGEVWYLTLLLD